MSERYRPIPAAERQRIVRSKLVEAAETAFARDGYAKTTIESIALVAGVSPRTVYRHFGNKSGLIAAWAGGWADGFVAAIAAEPVGNPLSERLRATIGRMRIDAARPLFREIAGDPDARGRWLATVHERRSRLAHLLRTGTDVDDPEQLSPQADVWELRAGLIMVILVSGLDAWLAAADDEPPEHYLLADLDLAADFLGN